MDNLILDQGSKPNLVWPAEGLTHIPDWVYTSEENFQKEREKIFLGDCWNFVALEAEFPEPGSYKRSYVGDIPVIVSRDQDGKINVFENRCAHRGVEFCRDLRGQADQFICPYHQWTYGLNGDLIAVPFRRGERGKGGMPADFEMAQHNPKRFSVAIRHGVIFASASEAIESIADYLGPETCEHFDAVFKKGKLKILGYYRNRLNGNWKLYHENLKDPYHATLLHVFLATFKLMVAGQKSAMITDATGRHATAASARDEELELGEDIAGEMKGAWRDNMKLQDTKFMNYVDEFDSPWTVTMQTIWPNLIIQRELNTLGIRHIVPRGPHALDMYWTMFGYESDDQEMINHRMRQGNLMGPSGYLGVDDNEAIRFLQEGLRRSFSDQGVVKLDPNNEGDTDTLISEASIRAMYRHYRQTMGL